MEELGRLVERARSGDLAAFGRVVERFQDMAYGCAYAVVGDFHLAQDVAQEAFLQAYRSLGKLQNADAFPGWFRRIILHCSSRVMRQRQPQTTATKALAERPSKQPEPAAEAADSEIKDNVLKAVRSLPDRERMVVTLFYINGYSQEEIAGFLEVPVTTVKNRLHTSRTRLRERMINMVADEMKNHPLPEKFPERIRLLLGLPRPLQINGHPAQELWQAFREHFSDFQVIELEEVHPRSLSLLDMKKYERFVYEVDKERILRPELTSQLVDLWLRKGKPACRWIACGRVFRRHQNDEGPTRLSVFHQAELFWCGPDADQQRGEKALRDVGARLLPGRTIRRGASLSYTPAKDAYYWEAQWRGEWFAMAGGGAFDLDWFKRSGVDPKEMRGYGFAYGLERTAQIRKDLDDVRKLWQPPYVPK